ncbi:hypothetical protein LTR20_007215 [Exophiala xenobiotica]|nr:hypothetical protein LTR40_008086 [Exophiala xenobiotica]KAK5380346.1 hypothetical protein LTS13_003203 [Exophiala xenobiotica]KAK5393014.1 hypothetical protein LTR79_009327 [Exophiala xenobiotica]KAK5412217.1 hypothetical protein LTR90_007780 [Exophiala xenobiotica]KAK5460788.1 hypothetical protein LTR20_007215 [Exophiala xenobiotica]
MQNLLAYLEELPVSRLPQTLQDAILTTQKIGLSYLWIDSMCIIQDDKVDKKFEIANMRKIFKNACVTIVAACSKSAYEGFLHPRKEPSSGVLRLPFLCPSQEIGTIYLGWQQSTQEIDLSQADIYTKTNPIESRCWTLEEKLLSQKMLIYSSTNLIWICKTKTSFDGGGWDFRPGPKLISIDGTTKPQGRTWREIIADYSQRLLSDERDKLRAISGLAQECSFRHPDQYLAGLWRSEMPSDLLWRVPEEAHQAISISTLLTAPSRILETRRQKVFSAARHMQYRAPSWSWASVDSPVVWLNYPSFSKHDNFELVDCSVTTASVQEPYGDVTDAKLRVRGPLVPLRSEQQMLAGVSHITCYFEDPVVHTSKEIFGLIVGRYIGGVWKREEWAGLLLCREPCAQHITTEFRRIGCFYTFDPDGLPEALTGYSIEEVAIV